MKNLILLCLLIINSFVFGQGLIINEISNGVDSTKEYIEFVVIGSSSNPLGDVDLSGWIIDDNNGDFNGSIPGVGIAQGHIKISSACLTSVKPGSIILIYNSAELSFTNDETDSDGDCIYVIPINSACLDNVSNLPISTNPNYFPSTISTTKIWNRIGLANTGDAAQVRKPDGTFYHGFSYGTVDTIYPNFPSEFGGTPSFNVINGTGAGRNHIFNSGDFTSQSNYTRGTTPDNETPGLPNNDFNKYFLNMVRNGSYDYSNLSNPINNGISTTLNPCFILLPIDLISFNGYNVNNEIKLTWEIFLTGNELVFDIERSSNGYEFERIGSVIGDPQISYYEYIDINPNNENYYRLKIRTENENLISNLINVNLTLKNDFTFYPNPIKNGETIKFGGENKIDRIKLYDLFGKCILDENITNNVFEIPKGLIGFYHISINIGNNAFNKKIIIK